MKQQKIYISGQVTGNSNYVANFLNAEDIVSQSMPDADIANPIWFCAPHWSWLRCMAVCIWKLIPCTHIAMIEGWQKSRGARIELAVVLMLRKQVHSICLDSKKYYPYQR